MNAETFYGGAEWHTVSQVTLNWVSKRVHQMGAAGGLQKLFALPDPTTRPARFRGGPHFVIVRPTTQAANVVIRTHDFIIVATLTVAGTYVKLWLTATGWKASPIHTIGTARAFNEGSRDLFAAEDNPVFDPVCREMDDPCATLELEGMVPLDGLHEWPIGSGLFPEVLMPFFQDPHIAKNARREAIRAADVVMPSVISVQFHEGEFKQDENHPKFSRPGGGTLTLSDDFWRTLYNNRSWHDLEWEGASWGTTSRHWHHIRHQHQNPPPDIWEQFTLDNVKRHVWRKVIPYGPIRWTGGLLGEHFQNEMEIRFVAEHTVSPEPTLVGGGGECDKEKGAYGVLFHIYVFTTEIGWVFVEPSPGEPAEWQLEDESYTPAGATGDISFSYNDPAVWGAHEVASGGNIDHKFCHPWLAICAHIPTTFQHPIGSNWVPMVDRRYFVSGGYGRHQPRTGTVGNSGFNRAACYTVSNGAPWSSVSCFTGRLSLDDEQGIQQNIVFKTHDAAVTANHGAITLGGDVPKSRPPEFVTIENAAGDGQTFLKPTKPGWDEDCGTLDIAGGSSISIRFCIDTFEGEAWPGLEIDECDGHPAEPLAGIGGTHRAFHNNGTTINGSCCISLRRIAEAKAYQRCVHNYVVFDDNCVEVDADCENIGYYRITVGLGIEDYDYNPGGSQENRMISWSQPVPDFFKFHDYVYQQSETLNFVENRGSWSFNALNITLAAAAGTSPEGLLRYAPAANIYRDYKVTAKITAAGERCGIGARTGFSLSQVDGFFIEVVDTPLNEPRTWDFRLLKIVDDVVEVLDEVLGVAHENDVVLVEIEVWGTDITARVRNASTEASLALLSAVDCDFPTGEPALLYREAAAGASVWTQFTVEDSSVEFFDDVTGTLGNQSASILFDTTTIRDRLFGEGDWCTREHPAGCGTPPNCDCIYYSEQFSGATSATHSGPGDIVPVAPPVDGDNPTWHGGPNPYVCDHGCVCPGCPGSCGGCPFPFVSQMFAIPQLEDRVASSPKLCRGVDFWTVVLLTCD